MEIQIKSTEEEQKVLIGTILILEATPHIKHMPHSLLAEKSEIKQTKVRAVLVDLQAAEYITVIKITDKPKYPRYYYHVTDAGRVFFAKENSTEEPTPGENPSV